MVYIKSMDIDVKALRNVLNLTQSELAKKLEVHTLTISRWERGIRKPRAIYMRRMTRLAVKNYLKIQREQGKC